MSTGELIAMGCAGVFIVVCVICLFTERHRPGRHTRRGGPYGGGGSD